MRLWSDGIWWRLGAAALALCLAACQDTGIAPTLWTVAEKHVDVGLVGGHQEITCADCHTEAGTLEGLDTACEACHLAKHAAVSDPDHAVLGYSTACAQCHASQAWRPASSHHDTTGFRLIGGHAGLRCGGCHEGRIYEALPEDCWSCHETDFGDATPDHEILEFDHDCTGCHTTAAWTPSLFDHDTTDFLLRGAHRAAACSDCHVASVHQELPDDCWSCHEADLADVEPDHVALEFDRDCTACHTVEAWTPSQFDHGATDFPLAGAHVEVACTDCHTTSVQETLAADCWSCHEADLVDVEPDHVALEFDRDCTACHTVEVWTPSQFDHGATDFPLAGAHVEVACTDCHTTSVQETLPVDCWSCHEVDLVDVVPDHVALEFDRDCTTCHTVEAWTPALFDHGLTGFALNGAHVEASCQSCHTEGFTETATECSVCHAEDEPIDHFGPACVECHTTTAWAPSTFDHETLFPLQSGDHRKYRNSCVSCHLEPSSYSVFTCTDCHDNEHTRSRTDREHNEVRNYRYDSAACFECHRTGRGEEEDDD